MGAITAIGEWATWWAAGSSSLRSVAEWHRRFVGTGGTHVAWPVEFAYKEQDSGMRREPLPFQLTITSSPLRLHVDPTSELDDVERAYFEMLARHSGDSNVEFVEIDPAPGGEPDSGVWFVDRTAVGPDGQYGLHRRVNGMQQGRATRYHVGEFARQLADRHGIELEYALQSQLRYETAHSVDVDLYVTTLEPLFGYRVDDAMFVCRPPEALAVVGLFQRLHGHLWVIDGFDTKLGTGRAEFATALALVPELQGMFPRIGIDLESWQATASLLRSARTRLERILSDRDHLIARHLLSGRAAPLAGAEALLERIALNISGLFDALARATNRALDLGVSPRHCSFQTGPLPARLPAPLSDVTAAMDLKRLLWAIGFLRNTIHQVNLGPGSYSDRSRRLEPVVSIPSDDAADFFKALAPFPQLKRWSVGAPDEYGLHLRPLPFLEDLLPLVIDAFRRILAVTPWPGHSNSNRFRYDQPELHDQLRRLHGLGSGQHPLIPLAAPPGSE